MPFRSSKVELIPNPEQGGFTARLPDISAYIEGATGVTEVETACHNDEEGGGRSPDGMPGPRRTVPAQSLASQFHARRMGRMDHCPARVASSETVVPAS